MGRPPLPTPLVSHESPLGVVPRGLPLRELWSRYLVTVDAQVNAGQLSESRRNQLRRSRDLCVALPDFPEKHHVVQWLTNLLPSRAPTTVRLHKWDLQSLYSWAIGNGLAGYTPLHRLTWRAPEPQRHAIRDIWEKWPRILSACRDEREAAFLGVMRYAGARPAEAQGLYAECVESWRAPWLLSVRQQRNAHTLDVKPTLKNRWSHRTLECRPELVELLRPVLASAPVTVRRIIERAEQFEVTPLLFPYRAADVSSLIERLRAALPDDFPEDNGLHVFRHTFAVEWYRWQRAQHGAADVLQLSRLLGHESVKYTQTYLRGLVGDDVVRGALSTMSGAPPWARAASSSVDERRHAPSVAPAGEATPLPIEPAPEQSALKLGPMLVKRSAVQKAGGAGLSPPDKVRAAPVAAGTALGRSRSNPSDSGNKNRRQRKATT